MNNRESSSRGPTLPIELPPQPKLSVSQAERRPAALLPPSLPADATTCYTTVRTAAALEPARALDAGHVAVPSVFSAQARLGARGEPLELQLDAAQRGQGASLRLSVSRSLVVSCAGTARASRRASAAFAGAPLRAHVSAAPARWSRAGELRKQGMPACRWSECGCHVACLQLAIEAAVITWNSSRRKMLTSQADASTLASISRSVDEERRPSCAPDRPDR